MSLLLPDELLPDELLPDELLPDELLPDELLPDELLPDELLPDELLLGSLLSTNTSLELLLSHSMHPLILTPKDSTSQFATTDKYAHSWGLSANKPANVQSTITTLSAP
jgi:hypothetical protein